MAQSLLTCSSMARFDPLDHLHRSHDGPVPADLVRAARAGSWSAARRTAARCVAAGIEARIVGTVRRLAARRRFSARAGRTDVEVDRLAMRVARLRHQAVALLRC